LSVKTINVTKSSIHLIWKIYGICKHVVIWSVVVV